MSKLFPLQPETRSQRQTNRSNQIVLQGFDFAFLRLSRVYDECSERTKYKWDSQYIGGNTLAVCNGETASAAHVLSLPQKGITLMPAFLISISRSTSSYFRSKDGVLSKDLSGNQEQTPTPEWCHRNFYQGVGGSKRARRIAARLPCMWRTMRKKGALEKAVITPKAVRKSSNKSFKVWYFIIRKVLTSSCSSQVWVWVLNPKEGMDYLCYSRHEASFCFTSVNLISYTGSSWLYCSLVTQLGHSRSLNEVKHEANWTARVAICSFCKQPHVADRTQG